MNSHSALDILIEFFKHFLIDFFGFYIMFLEEKLIYECS